MSYMTEDEWTGEETETVPKVNNTTQAIHFFFLRK